MLWRMAIREAATPISLPDMRRSTLLLLLCAACVLLLGAWVWTYDGAASTTLIRFVDWKMKF